MMEWKLQSTEESSEQQVAALLRAELHARGVGDNSWNGPPGEP